MMPTTTTRITKLSFTLLTSALLVLSSIVAAQLFVTNKNAAFAAINCEVTETDGTREETCVGGGSAHEEDTSGFGSRSTCTTDISTEITTCTFIGGSGFTSGPQDRAGGQGGIFTCTFNTPTGEDSCSRDAGGEGSKPIPDGEGG